MVTSINTSQDNFGAKERLVSSSNTTIHDNFGAADAPIPNAKKTDIVHPNDRLLRILREHSVKKKLPSVAFWDPDYKPSAGRGRNQRNQGVAEERVIPHGNVGTGISRGQNFQSAFSCFGLTCCLKTGNESFIKDEPEESDYGSSEEGDNL